MVVKQIKFIAATIKQAVNEFLADNCTHLSAAISYYILLSLFPLALAAITILGYFSRPENISARVTQVISDVLPGSGQVLSSTIQGVSQGGWGISGAIAVIGLLLSGMGFFGAVRKSLNTAWGIKQPRPFLRERLMEFLMMLGLGALLIASLGVTAAFKVIQAANLSIFGRPLGEGLFWHAIVILTSAALTFVVFLFLYKFVPNTRVRWRHVWVGALVAAVLIEIAKNVFVWFVGRFATYNLVYSSLSSIIALMVCSYIFAMILLFCAKLISAFTKMRPVPVPETPLAAASEDTAAPLYSRDKPDRKDRIKPKGKPSKADL